MNILIKILYVVLPTLLTSFLYLYVEREKPEIVYSISENVPLSDTEKKENSVQQIKISNIGDLTAENIQVKVNKEVTNYRIVNNSNSDEIEVFDQSGFEVIYKQLLPDGSFSVIIELSNTNLNNNDITVMSGTGKAINVLENKDIGFATVLVIISIIGFYFTVIFSNLRANRVETLFYKLGYNSREELDFIYRKKPFYFKNSEWEMLIKIFIEDKIRQSYENGFIDLEVDPSLKILKLPSRPKYISESNFESLKIQAYKAFKSKIKTLTSSYKFRGTAKVDEIYTKTYRIINQLAENKIDLLELLSKSYLEITVSNISVLEIDEVDNLLKTPKPDYINNLDWEKHQKHLMNEKYKLINKKLMNIEIYKDELVKLLDSDSDNHYNDLIYLSLLSLKIEEIFKFSFNRYIFDDESWIKEKDRKQLSVFVQKANTHDENLELVKTKLEVIDNVVFKVRFDPEKLREGLFKNNEIEHLSSIYNLLKELKLKESNLKSEKAKLIASNVEVDKLISKVTSQLNVIFELLKNPESIFRIESYNNPFTDANFELLLELAKELKKVN